MVVINKIDIPEVRDKLEELTKGIKKAAGHSRVLGISAATGERYLHAIHIVVMSLLVYYVTPCCNLNVIEMLSIPMLFLTSIIPIYRVKELMQRVRKVVDSLPTQSDFELFTEEEERVSFEDELNDKFEVFTDDAFPGQFRVVGDKIEKVCTSLSGVSIILCFTFLLGSICRVLTDIPLSMASF